MIQLKNLSKEGDKMQVYNDELYHFGILGMKWGRRKGPSTSDMRKDSVKTHRDEYRKALAKYNVNSQTNEKKYNKLELKASLESGKIASAKLMKKYGAENLKRLDRSNKIRNIAGIAGMMALPIGAIALGMRK